MSISNLFHPNDYQLYSGDGAVTSITVFNLPQQTLFASPAQTVTGYTIRGVSQPFNPIMAPAIQVVLSQSATGAIASLTIPAFSITATSPGNIISLRLTQTLPVQICPLQAMSYPIVLQASTGVVVGQLSISQVGLILLSLAIGTTNLGASTPYGGLVGDFTCDYVPAL